MKATSTAGTISPKIFRPSETASKLVCLFCALISAAAIAFICWFLASNAWPALKQTGLISFLLGKVWDPEHEVFGILPMILSTIYVSLLSLLIGVPAGLGTAVYLTFYCPKKFKTPMQQAVNILAGIPSLIYGLFGLMVLVPVLMNLFSFNGKGLLCASIVLGIMIIPTIVSMSASALQAVDPAMYENSLALGAEKERTIIKVVCKAARSGILAAIILGIGRAVGETMAVVMVAGNAPILPASVLSMTRTLSSSIVLEMGYAQGLHRSALIASALVLLVLVFMINGAFQAVKNRDLQG